MQPFLDSWVSQNCENIWINILYVFY
jgi:hypothetical protein